MPLGWAEVEVLRQDSMARVSCSGLACLAPPAVRSYCQHTWEFLRCCVPSAMLSNGFIQAATERPPALCQRGAHTWHTLAPCRPRGQKGSARPLRVISNPMADVDEARVCVTIHSCAIVYRESSKHALMPGHFLP